WGGRPANGAAPAAERLLARSSTRVALVELGRDLDGARAGGGRCEERRQPPYELGLFAVGREPVPLAALVDAERRAQLVDLALREQHRVVEGIAGEREPPPLDCAGQDDRGPVAHLPGRVERLDEQPEIVAPDVGDELRERGIARVGEQPVERAVDAAAVGRTERLAHGSGRQAQEPLILGVRHYLQALAQSLAAAPVEDGLQLASPPELAHAPARGLEHRAYLAHPPVRDDAVQR